MSDSSRTVPVERLTPAGALPDERTLPVEMPVAVEYNGVGYAVMMATPADLDDFAIGFSLSERIVDSASEVHAIDAHETPQGIVLRITIAQERTHAMLERVRVRVSESSCGLCGLENLEQVARPLPPISARLDVPTAAIFAALEALSDHQPLNKATGGAHAAAFCAPDGTILHAREDVGRHCALDKLLGALAKANVAPTSGFILLSSRCSYELVEKTAIAGCQMLVTISTATTLASDRAKAAGLTLIALARRDAMLRLG